MSRSTAATFIETLVRPLIAAKNDDPGRLHNDVKTNARYVRFLASFISP